MNETPPDTVAADAAAPAPQSPPDLSVRAHRPLGPIHPDIDAETIRRLVTVFYDRVREDARLGPIFETRLAGHWDAHLDRLSAFWSSVLLRSGAYKGEPVPVHRAMADVESADYARWLDLFRGTAREVFTPGAAAATIAAAERVAQSLWLARFGTAHSRPPAFLKGG